MPVITRKMANDARKGINTGKLSEHDYNHLNIPRKRVQRCGKCTCLGHKRTNCNVFVYNPDAHPINDAQEYHRIIALRVSRKPQTVYEYMESWINEHGTIDLTPHEYKMYVSHVDTFTKRRVKYRMTVASNSHYRYWF